MRAPLFQLFSRPRGPVPGGSPAKPRNQSRRFPPPGAGPLPGIHRMPPPAGGPSAIGFAGLPPGTGPKPLSGFEFYRRTACWTRNRTGKRIASHKRRRQTLARLEPVCFASSFCSRVCAFSLLTEGVGFREADIMVLPLFCALGPGFAENPSAPSAELRVRRPAGGGVAPPEFSALPS